MMIPARVAIALCADGWYLRDEIVWHKPNPMPESVTDRTTKSHEMLYLLTKNKQYYYDPEAIKERGRDSTATGEPRRQQGSGGKIQHAHGVNSRTARSIKDL